MLKKLTVHTAFSSCHYLPVNDAGISLFIVSLSPFPGGVCSVPCSCLPICTLKNDLSDKSLTLPAAGRSPSAVLRDLIQPMAPQSAGFELSLGKKSAFRHAVILEALQAPASLGIILQIKQQDRNVLWPCRKTLPGRAGKAHSEAHPKSGPISTAGLLPAFAVLLACSLL